MNEFGKIILEILDKSESERKAKWIAYILKGAAEGHYSFNDFHKMATIINKIN